jgi:hypothetical protein
MINIILLSVALLLTVVSAITPRLHTEFATVHFVLDASAVATLAVCLFMALRRKIKGPSK